ncbi:uncharacterized protein PFLUO_LOCUS5665 [Penicillium psychrofluorescens]|uniref:uncharacterized protein n=1 Tax=Penicillium psychrofluorescens TaxID=3158075 RepID=UPI003CCCBD47
MFLDLPNELILLIAEETAIWGDGDLFALLRTNRALHDLLLPFLYALNADEGGDALLWCAEYGFEKGVQRLLSLDVNPDLLDIPWSIDEDSLRLRDNKKAALHLASLYGHEGVVNTLLKHGAEVNLLDERSLTPLSYAVLHGHITIVKLLLENGASCDFPGDEITDSRHARWLSPLHCLSLPSRLSTPTWEPIFSLLLQHGTDINVQHGEMDTPLNYVTQERGTVISVPESISRLLLEHGADVHAVTQSDETPLHLSALVAHDDGVKVVKMLLERGADVNAQNDTGDTPLHLSALDYRDCTKVLLEHGADVNARNSEGQTPLRIAVEEKILPTVRLLLAHGADATIVDDDTGNNLLNLVGLSSKEDEVNLEIMTMLLDHGADVNHANYEGMTPLLYATCPENMPEDFYEHERKDIVKLLLDRGADVNAKTPKGINALHLTLKNGHCGFVHGFVEIFIENGIDVNAALVDGRTPLDMVKNKETRVILKHEIALLRQHGARNGVRTGA